MLGQIVPQVEEKVKCADEHCGEDVFCDGLCFGHFIGMATQEWDDEDAERQMVLGSLGYVFGDPVEVLA